MNEGSISSEQREVAGKFQKLTRDTSHDSRKSSSELFWLLHTLVNGKYESDSLEGEDGGSEKVRRTRRQHAVRTRRRGERSSPDKKRVFSRIEELDVGNSRGREDGDFVRGDVDNWERKETKRHVKSSSTDERAERKLTTNENEGICDESGSTKFRQRSDETEREEDGHLSENQPLDVDQPSSIGDGEEESLQVLRDCRNEVKIRKVHEGVKSGRKSSPKMV